MALSAARKRIDNRGPLVDTFGRPLETGKTFYANALVALFGGYLRPCTGAAGEIVVGVVDLGVSESITTAGSSGSTTPVTKLPVKRGVFPFKIGSSGDALTQAHAGRKVFGIDDETVGLTDGGVQRPIAGTLFFVEGTDAWVSVGFDDDQVNALVATLGMGADPDAISAAGTLSLDPWTLASVTGTTAYTLPNGTRLGQRKRVTVVAGASTPNATITPTTPRGFATVTALGAVGDFVEFEWTAAGWVLGPSQGVTIT